MWRWSPLSKRQEFTILSYPNGVIFHVSYHCFDLGLLHGYILPCLCLLQPNTAAKRAEAWKQLHCHSAAGCQAMMQTQQKVSNHHWPRNWEIPPQVSHPVSHHTVTSSMETLFLLWLYLNNPGHGHSPLLSFPAPQMWLSGPSPQQSSLPQDSSRGVNKANQVKGLYQRCKSCRQKEDKGSASSLWSMHWLLNPGLKRERVAVVLVFLTRWRHGKAH